MLLRRRFHGAGNQHSTICICKTLCQTITASKLSMSELGKKVGKNLSKKFGNLIYALAFQAGWFVCIVADNLISIVYTLAFLACHFWLTQNTRRPFLNK